MNMGKKCILFVLLLSLLPAFSALGASGYGRVTDDAGLFSGEERSRLQTELDRASEKTGWDFVLCTTDDTGIYNTAGYSDVMYEQMYKDGEVGADGVCFTIDMAAGEFYVSTQGKAIKNITDAEIDGITGDFVDEFRNTDGDMYRASLKAIDSCLEKSGKKHISFLSILFALIPSFLISALVGVIFTGNIKKEYAMNNVTAAESGFIFPAAAAACAFTVATDDFVRRDVSRRVIKTQSSNPGGGSSTHSGPSSGPMGGSMKHGGGGRSFK